MDYDEGKVDEMVLALLYLTSFTEQGFVRAWKGHDWDALNRLHESGLISDPKNKKQIGRPQQERRQPVRGIVLEVLWESVLSQ